MLVEDRLLGCRESALRPDVGETNDDVLEQPLFEYPGGVLREVRYDLFLLEEDVIPLQALSGTDQEARSPLENVLGRFARVRTANP